MGKVLIFCSSSSLATERGTHFSLLFPIGCFGCFSVTFFIFISIQISSFLRQEIQEGIDVLLCTIFSINSEPVCFDYFSFFFLCSHRTHMYTYRPLYHPQVNLCIKLYTHIEDHDRVVWCVVWMTCCEDFKQKFELLNSLDIVPAKSKKKNKKTS